MSEFYSQTVLDDEVLVTINKALELYSFRLENGPVYSYTSSSGLGEESLCCVSVTCSLRDFSLFLVTVSDLDLANGEAHFLAVEFATCVSEKDGTFFFPYFTTKDAARFLKLVSLVEPEEEEVELEECYNCTEQFELGCGHYYETIPATHEDPGEGVDLCSDCFKEARR